MRIKTNKEKKLVRRGRVVSAAAVTVVCGACLCEQFVINGFPVRARATMYLYSIGTLHDDARNRAHEAANVRT